MLPIEKIEEFVHRGLVLDEHGGWIPLAEKLRKERVFLRHLEDGEVLFNGSWIKIADVPRAPLPYPEETRHILVDDKATVDDETVYARNVPSPGKTKPTPVHAPEETVSLSAIGELPKSRVALDPESDAPETRIFSIERPDPNASSGGGTGWTAAVEDTQSGDETQSYRTDVPGVKTAPVPLETEFEETVLYNIDVLRKSDGISRSRASNNAAAAPQSSPSFRLDEDDDAGNWQPQRNRTAVIIGLVVAVTLLLAFLARILF